MGKNGYLDYGDHAGSEDWPSSFFGMHVMSSGLERLAGGRLEQVLKKMTSNTFKSFLLGLGITAAIQSSSAVTVMLVGLVNSGLMEIGQTVGCYYGLQYRNDCHRLDFKPF